MRTGRVYHVPLSWDGREALRGALTYDVLFNLVPQQEECAQGGILLGDQSSALLFRHQRSQETHRDQSTAWMVSW